MADSRPRQRQTAARALSALGDPQAVPALIGALRDADRVVRREDALALRLIRDLRAVEPLHALLTDPDKDIHGLATRILGAFGDPRSIDPLTAALEAHSGGAAQALTRIRAPAIPVLRRLQAVRACQVRREATRALRRLGEIS